jgi:hypothetical protein
MQVLLWQNTKIKQNKIEQKYTKNNKRTRKSLVLFVLDLLYGQASLHILAKTKTHPSNPANTAPKPCLHYSINFLTKSNNPCLQPSQSLAKAGII